MNLKQTRPRSLTNSKTKTTNKKDAKIRQKYNKNSSNQTKKTPKRVEEEENNEEEEEDEMASGVTKRYVRRAPNSRIIEEYFIEPTISSASPGVDTSLRLNEANIVRKRQLKRSSSETAMRGEDESTSSSSSNGFGLTKSKSSKNLAGMSSLRTYIKNRNAINIYDSMPHEFMPPLFITNQNEVKKKFLESNVPPVLKFKGDNRSIKNILGNYSKPNYTHFFKAKEILDSVRGRYPSMNAYYEANFGKKVSSETCVDIIGKYLSKNRITGDITVNFAPGLTCSGRIASYGQKNKPETRRFLVWINNDEENQFLRRKGIVSLCDHEIGTHYYRAFNDGLQIWYGDREKFGLRPLNSSELLKTEEGLAALHTLMNADLEYLFLPALLYYLVCMAERMTFEQLFNHMEKYIELPAERWKLVTRVKRGISDPHTRGCYSRDQSYFEGAVEILQNLDSIDFFLLMSGKLCLDELEKVKRLAKIDQIKVPAFFKSIKAYKEKLRHIGIVNGIIEDGNNHREEVVLDLQTKQRRELNPNRPMASYEIERFINNEIVAKTKNTIDIKPPPNIDPNNANSSLCAIL